MAAAPGNVVHQQPDEGLRPDHIQSYGNPVEQTWQKVYQAYQEACDRAGLATSPSRCCALTNCGLTSRIS
ncbi:hypothetical protein ACLK19_25695 [Escherichia coli]